MCNEEVKLFGVRILSGGDRAEDVMRKSASTGNLVSLAPSEHTDRGYLSESGRGKRDRKRGLPWTKEEHRTFLVGLEKLGKGDWKGISRRFVITRTPTQVASHAQKYFLRKTASNKKRRSSLFDMLIDNNVSTSDADPALSLMRTKENPEGITLRPHDNNMDLSHFLEAPLTSPPIEARNATLNYVDVDMMSGHASENPIKDDTLQSSMISASGPASGSSDASASVSLKPNHMSFCMHNFLRRTPSPPHGSDSYLPSEEMAELQLKGDCDLELSIAPPSQLNSSKLPSRMSIRVI